MVRFILLQCIFGLFRSALKTYYLKSLLGPNITLAKTITSKFFRVFSKAFPQQSLSQRREESHQSLRWSTPTAYDLIMLEVDDILPSPLTPLAVPHPVAETVCEMQSPALFTMTQSSPQPQSVYPASYAWLNPLPSPATSAFFSGELQLYSESETSSPSVPVDPPSSTQ